MENTGVYWRPVYETIEAYSPGYDCLMVVNAQHMRNLPGSVKDAEWIATLLRYGLLENSFITERTIRDLREFAHLRGFGLTKGIWKEEGHRCRGKKNPQAHLPPIGIGVTIRCGENSFSLSPCSCLDRPK